MAKNYTVMQNPFKDGANLDLYQNRGVIRWMVLVFSVVIGGASIVYTQVIVGQLRERERRFINLYANALEFVSNDIDQENINLIVQDIIVPNNSIPVIVTDENHQPTNVYKNIRFPQRVDTREERKVFLLAELEEMRAEHEPILLEYRGEDGELLSKGYVYYKNSDLLTQLRYYPYVQLSVIGLFAFLVYLAFSYSKRAEQNKVWVGLAKETAHQLGTPLSALMAWLEYFKADEDFAHKEVIGELEKDVEKLRTITERFSSIGSEPVLKDEPIYEVTQQALAYLQKRISTKVALNIQAVPQDLKAKINKPLYDWVIENLCKNAVDAMGGEGQISIHIFPLEDWVAVDVSDTGKGIPKGKLRAVFQPGFTTKQRGWGLGLTLVKRIVEQYHGGKIFVKHSEVDRGTTFRIFLMA